MRDEGGLFGNDLPLIPAPVDETSVLLREIAPEELGLRFAREGQFDIVVSDSRKFAKVFGKSHKHVLEDIDSIRQKIGRNIGQSFFHDGTYFDDYGRRQRCIDLTKRGALFLGARYDPMIMVAVLTAFEAMANALGERAAQHVQPVFDVIEATMARMEQTITDTVVTRVEQTFAPVFEALEWIQAFLHRRRVDVSPQDRRTHCATVHTFFGGRCPCCQLRQILDSEGEVLVKENGIPVADYDHQKQSAVADLHHTWLICTGDKESCHYKVTHGPHAVAFRLASEHAWSNYQRRVFDHVERVNLQDRLL